MKRTTVITTLPVLVLSLVLGLACSREGTGTSGAVQTQLETAQRIGKLEQEIDGKQAEVNALLRQYVQSGGQDIGAVTGQGLSPEQASFLEKKLRSEEGVGYKDLLSDILAKQKAIEDLGVKVQDLEKSLPSPVEVSRGERHYDIAMNYLTREKGLAPDAAKDLVKRVNLMDELVPGFKVWNFYGGGVYGTFVTQGEATVSPYGVIQHAKNTLVNEKNTAIGQRDALAKEKDGLTRQVADLETRRIQLEQDVSLLSAEREELTRRVNDLHLLSTDLESQMNSVFYRIGSRRNLENEGVIRASWFGKANLASFTDSSFPQRLDLRNSDTITITAAEARVDAIRRVSVAPTALYKAGKDYAVSLSADRQSASVRILHKDKFKAERSVAILVN